MCILFTRITLSSLNIIFSFFFFLATDSWLFYPDFCVHPVVQSTLLTSFTFLPITNCITSVSDLSQGYVYLLVHGPARMAQTNKKQKAEAVAHIRRNIVSIAWALLGGKMLLTGHTPRNSDVVSAFFFYGHSLQGTWKRYSIPISLFYPSSRSPPHNRISRRFLIWSGSNGR